MSNTIDLSSNVNDEMVPQSTYTDSWLETDSTDPARTSDRTSGEEDRDRSNISTGKSTVDTDSESDIVNLDEEMNKATKEDCRS